jgi:hypothetical protein
MAGRVSGRRIEDDDPLTQHGRQMSDGSFDFRNRLRVTLSPPETTMSLLDGRFSPDEAGELRFGHRRRNQRHPNAARYTTAGKLRNEGFQVTHTPRLPMSPNHVSVTWDGDWDGEVAGRFDACFDGEQGGESSGD